jgi:hypothetical protein
MEQLNFKGPFPLFGKGSILKDSEVIEGIYLWTVLVGEVYKIHYVGSSNNIIRRLRDEVNNVITLRWTAYDPIKIKTGCLDAIFTPDGTANSDYVRRYFQNPIKVLDSHFEYLKACEIFHATPKDNKLKLKDIEHRCIYDARAEKCSGKFLDNTSPSGKNRPNELQIAYNFTKGNVNLVSRG